MADSTLWTTLITALGAGTSALGAVVLTNRGTMRHQAQRHEQEQADRRWSEHAETEAERHLVLSRLLKTAGRVKASAQLLGGGFRPDLRERVRLLDHDAMSVAEDAALVAILYAGEDGTAVAVAAQELANATARLIVDLENAIRWERSFDGEAPSSGEVTADVSAADFDACVAGLHRALSRTTSGGDSTPGGTAPPPRRGQLLRMSRRRRDASSR
jgi:hypothetical protein